MQCYPKKEEKSKYYIVQTGFADWNMTRPVDFIEVIPESVGQYTGLKDLDGKAIYEGDIIRKPYITYENHKFIRNYKNYEVIFNNNLCCFNLNGFYDSLYDDPTMGFSEEKDCLKIIGNIYDNPELLEAQNEVI